MGHKAADRAASSGGAGGAGRIAAQKEAERMAAPAARILRFTFIRFETSADSGVAQQSEYRRLAGAQLTSRTVVSDDKRLLSGGCASSRVAAGPAGCRRKERLEAEAEPGQKSGGTRALQNAGGSSEKEGGCSGRTFGVTRTSAALWDMREGQRVVLAAVGL